MARGTEVLFAEAVRKNPRWAGLPLVRLGNSRIVMPDPSTWVPAHCSVCDRPLGAIGVPGKPMLVCPGDERSGPDGPQYRCDDRDECARYADGQQGEAV